MKKILTMFLIVLIGVGLTGCDLLGNQDIPATICDEGYHLEGTACVLDDETPTNQIPTITLVGNPTITLTVGATYTDAGATATDPEDGSLTTSIVVVNTVNTAVAGTYTVTYNVTDSDGGAAVAKVRTVVVQAAGATVPVITLVGSATVTITVGATYTDQGATATDTQDGNLTTSIVKTTTVNTAVVGTYTVTYNVTDSDGGAATPVVRTVIVQALPVTAPVITLVGLATVTVPFGGTYADQGATASDAEDGNITSSIVTVNPVDTSVAGTYVITYNVTDSAGGAATQVTRTVIVLPSDGEVLANYIVSNWDGTMTFLGAAMISMDFSSAMTLTTEIDFETTEDIDEVHYIHAEITDQFVYAETGDALKRTIDLDVDDETTITISMIFKEVPTGVHVYIEYGPIFDMIELLDPNITDMLGWVGFDGEWAVFEIDDSLQNVIEIAVVKDMLVGLFFSEVGAFFFYELQTDLEAEIGFGLDQYGVDLGQFIDYLIEEDFVNAEIELQGVNYEAILLHFDALYVSWQLGEAFNQYTVELGLAGFDITKLAMLETAVYDETLQEMVLTPSVPDPLKGTQAFFNALTEAELQSIVDVVIKPLLEGTIYDGFSQDLNPEWLDANFQLTLEMNEQFLIDNWPEASGTFVLTTEVALLQSIGSVQYWNQLTYDEQGIIRWSMDMNSNGWVVDELQRMWERPEDYYWMFKNHEIEFDIYQIESDIYDLLNQQGTYISTTYSIDVSVWVTEIETNGLLKWYDMLGQPGRDALQDAQSQTGAEIYLDSYNELLHMSMEPWMYSWWYRDGDMMLNDQWITDTFDMLITQNQAYLVSDYGFDIPVLLTAIHQYGGIEWYLDYATQDEIDALHEIMYFSGAEDHMWAVEEMDRVLEHSGNYYWWFGRQADVLDPQQASDDLTNLLSMYYFYLSSTYQVDVVAWQNDIDMYGGIEWFMGLNSAEQAMIDEISLMDQTYYYRWTVEVLQRAIANPEDFSWGYCSYNGCLDEENMTNALVEFIQNNAGYLAEEYSYDVTALIETIEYYGAFEWYNYYSTDFDHNALYDIAEQSRWQYEVLWAIDDIMWQEEDLLNLLYIHETELNTLGFDATQAILDIETYGIQVYVNDYLTEADIEFLMDALVYPLIDDLLVAIDTGEVAEFLTELLFTDPHVLGLLDSEEYFPFDNTIIAANMLLVDYDALVLETIDLQALLLSVQAGQVAYDAFVTGISVSAPNMALFLEVLSPTVFELEPYMIYMDDVQYAMDGLSVFEGYFNMDYWVDDSNMDMALDVTDEFYIETIMTLDPIMYQSVVQDLLVDLNTYLSGFTNIPFPYDVDWDCVDPLDESCMDLEISELMALLTQLGDLQVRVLMDPSDATWMEIQFDLTDFLDVLVVESNAYILEDSEYVADPDNNIMTGINNATITITMSEGGTIVYPTTPSNVNDIAQDAAKFAVVMTVRDYLREIQYYYEMNPSELLDLTETSYSLSDFDFLHVSAAFDADMSTISVEFPSISLPAPSDSPIQALPTMPTFSITVYWVDGTEALTGTVGLDDLQALFDQDNNLTGQVAWDTMVGFVNDTNFNTTKLFLMFLLQDNYDDSRDKGFDEGYGEIY